MRDLSGPLTLLDPCAPFSSDRPGLARRDHRGPHPGGYVGVRLAEAQNPGPADHERDSAQEETCPRRSRINESGDATPGSQESITRGVQNLQLADVPAAQPVHAVRAPPTMPNSRRPTQQRPRHERAYLRCAQCGADPHTFSGGSDNRLMIHMGRKHGGQSRIQESVAQLRQLGRTIRSRRGNRCNHYRADTATRDILVGDIFQDRRHPGTKTSEVTARNKGLGGTNVKLLGRLLMYWSSAESSSRLTEVEPRRIQMTRTPQATPRHRPGAGGGLGELFIPPLPLPPLRAGRRGCNIGQPF